MYFMCALINRGTAMQRIANLVIILSILNMSSFASARPSYVEALRCYDRFAEQLGQTNAAVLCRGIAARNATAVYNCVGEGMDRTQDLAAVALVCQGIEYRITTATLNCFDEAITLEMSPWDAASLCQKTDYSVYADKMRCFNDAIHITTAQAAAQLCGGIAL